MVRMVDPAGKERDIKPEGVAALSRLGWQPVAEPKPEPEPPAAPAPQPRRRRRAESSK